MFFIVFNLGFFVGFYNLIVVDVNGCVGVMVIVEVVDLLSIEVFFMDILLVSCFEGVCDG